jgi:hypothetical protein
MNRYRSIDFSPNSTDPKLFNLWTGYERQEVKYENLDSIQPILWHLKHIICNNCEESYEYFLDLLYWLLKYPEKPLGVATFIHSRRHGSGKNILLDFLQEYVFGNNVCYYTQGLETVMEKHNAMLKNKKVVIVDELASSKDRFVANFDKLKSMMTGPFISINPKGVNQYCIKNVLGWFLISNHEDCIRLEQSDRRYFCLSVSEEKIGDEQYFDDLGATFNQDMGNTFYTYILERGDNSMRDINIRIPPLNAFKRSIVGAGWSSSVRYLYDLKDAKPDCAKPDCDAAGLEGEENDIGAMRFYDNYVDWCRRRGFRVKNKTKFGKDTQPYITKKRTMAGLVYDLKSITIRM